MTLPVYGDAGVPPGYLEPQQWVAAPAYDGGGYYAHYGGRGVHLSEPQLQELWIQAGGPPAAAPVAAAIAEQKESGGWSDAWNSAGATGFWQIMYPGSAPPGTTRPQLFTPAGNAKAAVRLYDASGWAPWGSDASQVHPGPLAPAKTPGLFGSILGAVTGNPGGLAANLAPNPVVDAVAGANPFSSTTSWTGIAITVLIVAAGAGAAVIGAARLARGRGEGPDSG